VVQARAWEEAIVGSMAKTYLPRSVFECDRKIRYNTDAAARQAEAEARARGGMWLHTYYCRYCTGYHVGHVTNWKMLEGLARARGLTRCMT